MSQGDSNVNQGDLSQGDSSQGDSVARGDNEEESDQLSIEDTDIIIGLLETVVILWCSVLPQLEQVLVCCHGDVLWSAHHYLGRILKCLIESLRTRVI